MKCVYGHQCNNSWEDQVRNRFVKLDVIFLTNEQLGRASYEYDPLRKPNVLYMCPRCGTVRAERD